MLAYLKLSGSAYEQGFTHGQVLKDAIRDNLTLYFQRFASEVKLDRKEVLRRAALYKEAIKEQNKAYYQAMQGLAKGSGHELDDIVALNVRYEILYYEFAVGESLRTCADGCTSFALLPERSKDNHLIIGQTWDWIPGVKGALIHSYHDKGFESLAFTEAGIVGGKIGMNTSGLGLCINGLASLQDDWESLHKPFHVRCYEILQAKSLEEAQAVLTEEERACSANFLLAQPPATALTLETTPKALAAIQAERAVLSHANHFVKAQDLGIEELDNEFKQFSCQREARLRALLLSKDKFDIADLKIFLQDHHGHPNSVCRHEDVSFGPEEHYRTLTAVLMDLTEQTLWISDGPPCENAFEVYSLRT